MVTSPSVALGATWCYARMAETGSCSSDGTRGRSGVESETLRFYAVALAVLVVGPLSGGSDVCPGRRRDGGSPPLFAQLAYAP
jgi:hypothetical protein